MNTTTAETVTVLRDGMVKAAAVATKSSPDILGAFRDRLQMRLTFETQETQQKIQWIVEPILAEMAKERGTEE